MDFKFANPNDFENAALFAVACAELNGINILDTIDSKTDEATLIEFTSAVKEKFKEKKKTYSLDVEVFSAGRWNGLEFSQTDIKSIANNFHKLKEFHRVPLKFGHNNEQPFTDGQPALGWVDNVFVKHGADGKEKLFAHFVDMPKIVYDAINAGLYKYVSIELDFDVIHKGVNYDMVLSGVALLGADLPAVNNIADLKTYMSRGFDTLDIALNRRKSFTIYDEVIKMDKDQIAALQAELDKIKAEKLKLESEKMEFERKEKVRLETEKAEKIKTHREKIEAVFKKAVTDMKLTPAKVEVFSKMLGVSDDEKVLAVDVSDIEKLIQDEKPMSQKSESFSKQENHAVAKNDGETCGEFLHREAVQFSIKNKVAYRDALNMVYQLHPEQAKKHVNAQG